MLSRRLTRVHRRALHIRQIKPRDIPTADEILVDPLDGALSVPLIRQHDVLLRPSRRWTTERGSDTRSTMNGLFVEATTPSYAGVLKEEAKVFLLHVGPLNQAVAESVHIQTAQQAAAALKQLILRDTARLLVKEGAAELVRRGVGVGVAGGADSRARPGCQARGAAPRPQRLRQVAVCRQLVLAIRDTVCVIARQARRRAAGPARCGRWLGGRR